MAVRSAAVQIVRPPEPGHTPVSNPTVAIVKPTRDTPVSMDKKRGKLAILPFICGMLIEVAVDNTQRMCRNVLIYG
jgi:hypothetical protein